MRSVGSDNGFALVRSHAYPNLDHPYYSLAVSIHTTRQGLRNAWWLRSVDSSGTFAYINSQNIAVFCDASYTSGSRPMWLIG